MVARCYSFANYQKAAELQRSLEIGLGLLALKGLGLRGSQLCVCLSDIVVCVGLCGCVRRRCSSHCRAQVCLHPSSCLSQPHSRLSAPSHLSSSHSCLPACPTPSLSPGRTPTIHAELPLLELADSKHRVGAARAYLSDYFAGALVESQVHVGAPPSLTPFTHKTLSLVTLPLSHLAPSPVPLWSPTPSNRGTWTMTTSTATAQGQDTPISHGACASTCPPPPPPLPPLPPPLPAAAAVVVVVGGGSARRYRIIWITSCSSGKSHAHNHNHTRTRTHSRYGWIIAPSV